MSNAFRVPLSVSAFFVDELLAGEKCIYCEQEIYGKGYGISILFQIGEIEHLQFKESDSFKKVCQSCKEIAAQLPIFKQNE